MHRRSSPPSRLSLNLPPLASGECGPCLCFCRLIVSLLFSITIYFYSSTPSFTLSPLSLTFCSSLSSLPSLCLAFPLFALASSSHLKNFRSLSPSLMHIYFPGTFIVFVSLLVSSSLTLTQAGLVLWASSMKHPAPSIYLSRLQVSQFLLCSQSESLLSSVPRVLTDPGQ